MSRTGCCAWFVVFLMVRILLVLLILVRAVSGQEALQVDLYALPPRIHTRLDLALFTNSETFLATLKKIEGASAVEKPVSFRKPIGWGGKSVASQVEPVRFFVSYDTDSEKLKGEEREVLKIGYEAEWLATREAADAAKLAFSFTWIPLYKKNRIRGGGTDDWMPTHPILHTKTNFIVKKGEPTLAAVWSSPIETKFNPKEETWLYLLVVRQP